MNIIGKWLGLDKAVLKAYNSGLQTTLYNQVLKLGWNVAVYPSWDMKACFEKAFGENAVYFALTDRIANKFAHIPRYVYKNEEGKKGRRSGIRTKALDENIAQGSELMNLLLRPNDYQGQDQFFYLVGLSFVSCGEVFVWKNRGGTIGGKPLEVYVIPPWHMQPVSDGTLFGVQNYKLEVSGKWVDIPKEDVIHWKKPSLCLDPATGQHLRGFNPLLPEKKVLTQLESITDASVSMYQNGGARGILYNATLDNIDETARQRIQNVVDNKINNTDVKGSVATIQGEWGYLNVGLNSVDMDLIKAEESVVKKICFALGYPYEMYSGDATHANREQSMYHLLTQTIAPMVKSFDDELNRALLPDFKENGFVASDMSELPEMQAMRLQQLQGLSKIWQLTPNQVLSYIGEQPNPNKLMDEVWIPSGYLPIDEASIGQPMTDPNTSDYNAG